MTRSDSIDFIDASSSRPAKDNGGATALRWSAKALVAVAWISAAIFGLYIVAYYLGAAYQGAPDQWNAKLPRLYDPDGVVGTIGIGAHFATGAIVLLLGPVQLIGAVRRRAPRLHRWIGRIYASAALLTGLGGLSFTRRNDWRGADEPRLWFVRRANGHRSGHDRMAGAATTFRRASRLGDRLFALAIGSWLYRMDYGFWHIIAHAAGHRRAFDGPFDFVMFFFFYVPNLIIAEAFIRARQPRASSPRQNRRGDSIERRDSFFLRSQHIISRLLIGGPPS